MLNRGIVIVHGVGEAKKGSYIDGFVEPLATFLSKAAGFENVSVEARNPLANDATTWATLHLKDPANPKNSERWHIREAWWAQSFEPGGAQSVLGWGVVAAFYMLVMTLKYVLWRNILRTVHARTLETWSSEVQGRPRDSRARPTPISAERVWLIPGARVWKAAADMVVWAIVGATYLALDVVGLAILLPVYLFLLTPFAGLFPKQVGAIQRKLINLLISSIGDQQAITTRRFALSSCSDDVSRALWPMLSSAAIASRHKTDPEFTGFATVTVVAHSGGCVVSYDALASEQVQRWLAEAPPDGCTKPKRVNWVTAGSGLNLAWRMHRAGDEQDRAFWRRIEGWVNWLNIYARYDPVPQGPPPSKMVEAMMGVDPETRPPGAVTGPRPPYVNLRVANTDFAATDHFGYWLNAEEVLSRVVQVVADDSLSTTPLSPEVRGYAASTVPGLTAHIKDSVEAAETHRAKVLRDQIVLYLGLTLVIVGLIVAARAMGRWLLGSDTFLWFDELSFAGHTLDEVVPTKLFGVPITKVRHWGVGALGIAFLGLTLVQLARLVVCLGDWVWKRGMPWWGPVLIFGAFAGVIAALAAAIILN